MTALWDTHRQMGWPAGSSGRLTLDKTRSARQGRHPPHSTFSSSGRVQVTPSQEKAQSAGMAGPAKAGASWRCVQVRSQADAGIVTTGAAGVEVNTGRPPDLRRWAKDSHHELFVHVGGGSSPDRVTRHGPPPTPTPVYVGGPCDKRLPEKKRSLAREGAHLMS
ncbi:unnamed protein product [Rangifer tarandus platyrhynchus]|uniref:Uncharacterized protein n=1 Tax=Rangifer tarandus platyrhynchus TaxID=3082113 RepID=A0AC59ZMD2_RANTA